MPLRFGKRLDKSESLLLVDLLALLAVGDLNKLHLGVLGLAGELLLHEVDPRVLVGRSRCRGKDGELALIADEPAHALEHLLGEAVRLRLIDEERASVLGHVRVVGDDSDPLLRRALQRWGDGICIVACDRDDIDLLRDQIVDELDLGVGGCCGRRLLDDLATDLALRLLGAGLGDAEIGIGVELRKQADGDRSGRALSSESGGGDDQTRERRGARHQSLDIHLGFPLLG